MIKPKSERHSARKPRNKTEQKQEPQPKQHTPSSKRRTIASRHPSEELFSSDLVELYEYKCQRIVKTLENIIRTYEADHQTADRLWRSQSARFVECRGFKLKPLNTIGSMLVRNGQFLVSYARLLKLNPQCDREQVKKVFQQQFLTNVTRNQYEFRRYFEDSSKKRQNDKESRKKLTYVPKITPIKKVEKVDGSYLKRQVPKQQLKAGRKSISQRQYDEQTKRMMSQNKPEGPPQTQVVLHKGVSVTEDQFQLLKCFGVQDVYNSEDVSLLTIVHQNFQNKGFFGTCLIKTMKFVEDSPRFAMFSLPRFALTDSETIASFKKQYSKVDIFIKALRTQNVNPNI